MSSGDARKYDVVCFWKQNDTGIYGRRQEMLVKYLAASERINQIVHFDAPISIGSLIKLFVLRKTNESSLVFFNTLLRAFHKRHEGKIKNHTFIFRPRHPIWRWVFFMFPHYLSYPSFVQGVLKKHKLGAENSVFYVCPLSFEFPSIYKDLKPRFVICDLIDDQRTLLEIEQASLQKFTDNYQEIIRVSQVIVANCEQVANDLGHFGKKIHVIPNACEPLANVETSEKPKLLKNIPSPIVGYVGNLSWRIDIELLEQMAEERPQWNIVLIGSAHRSSAIMRLKRRKNVHFLGVVPYEKVIKVIPCFDVAIIPHTIDSVSASMNPLKLFVYCASGIPVVTTDIQNIGELRDLVNVARSRDEFIEQVELALSSENAAANMTSRQLLERNSWGQRVSHLMRLVDQKWKDDNKGDPS